MGINGIWSRNEGRIGGTFGISLTVHREVDHR